MLHKIRDFICSWLKSSKKRNQFFAKILQKLVPILLILLLNPYHLLDRQAELSSKIMMSALAPFYPRPQTSTKTGQDRIAVVLFRQSDLDQGLLGERKSWPPNLADYTAVLRRIVASEPAAIFIDLKIGPHIGEDIKGFHDYLKRLNARTPVFLVRLPRERDEDQKDQNLDISADAKFDDAVSGRILSQWDGHDIYPIYIKQSGQLSPAARLWYADLERRQAVGTLSGKDEEALQQLRLLEKRPEAAEQWEPMVIRWASQLPQEMRVRPKDCKDYGKGAWFPNLKRSLSVLARGLAPGLPGISAEEGAADWNIVTDCTHSLTLSVEDLRRVTAGSNDSPLLKGRIVIIGADITGINDYWDSPVHGKVQGALLHAMALENLLDFNRSYLHEAPHFRGHLLELAVEVIAMLFASFAVVKPAERLLYGRPSGLRKTGIHRISRDPLSWFLFVAAISGIVGASYGGMDWRILLVSSLLCAITLALLCFPRLGAALEFGPGVCRSRFAARRPLRYFRPTLFLCVVIVSGLGAFTLFVVSSFALVALLMYWSATIPSYWLAVVTAALYATIGEPLLEAVKEKVLGMEAAE